MLWILVLIAAVIIYATLIERFWFAIRKAELKVLPKGKKDIVILHISDIHMAPWQRYKANWISKLEAKIKPDLIINTGDNLGHRDGIDPVLSALNNLGKTPGVFVNGSNDLYAPILRNPLGYLFKPSDRHRETEPALKLNTDKLVAGFEKFGWLNLNNSAGTLAINGTTLGFIGTDDPHEGRENLDAISNPTKAELLIGVTHAPYEKVLDGLSGLGAEIIFAGHTHGGQVCWPFLGKALVTNCDLPTKQARGLFNRGKYFLNVCAGLGNSIYAPIRLACRPEVRVITLKAKN